MGLWGADPDCQVSNSLPPLPKSAVRRDTIEAEALRNRIVLQVAKLELEATARSYGLTEATRYVTDLEILTGFETEREIEDDEKTTRTTAQVELEFAMPIFDTGKPGCATPRWHTCGRRTCWRRRPSTSGRRRDPLTRPTARTTTSRGITATASRRCALRSKMNPC
ncbi:hypothetical protein EV128_10664 [Rhizobium azibense]|nr:hypothetical protein EV128_10664 [Rhizobium azibense]